jgi:lipoyl(octanoyl) transferase
VYGTRPAPVDGAGESRGGHRAGVGPAIVAEHVLHAADSSRVDPAALVIRDLGRMSYAEALLLQREVHQRVVASRAGGAGSRSPGELLLLEHDPPVITISRRPDARRHLVASEAQLRAAGVQVAETDRGGDITYHGPGQLVAYPILDLNLLNLRINSYMRMLEQIVIDVLARFGIQSYRDPGATGVWTDLNSAQLEAAGLQSRGVDDQPSGRSAAPLESSTAKICAMGVRVSRWVSMHGLALNVSTNLDHFHLIVPCGLAGRSVTSMRAILGEACPSLAMLKAELASAFTRGIQGAAKVNPS